MTWLDGHPHISLGKEAISKSHLSDISDNITPGPAEDQAADDPLDLGWAVLH